MPLARCLYRWPFERQGIYRPAAPLASDSETSFARYPLTIPQPMHHLHQYVAMSILVLGCAHLDANEPEPANPNFRFGNATKHLYKSTGSARLHLHCFFPPNHRSSDKRAAIVGALAAMIFTAQQQYLPATLRPALPAID